jgi:hypothetical protein
MKRLTVTTIGILTAGLCLSASVARAEPQDESIVANVPFDFVVGSVQMPAGKYIVKTASDDPSVAMIESADGRHQTFALTLPAEQRATGQATLVFEKHDNRYFLTRLMDADGDGRELMIPHAGRQHEVVTAPVNP